MSSLSRREWRASADNFCRRLDALAGTWWLPAALILSAYAVGYYIYPARPGRSIYPQGWWGWFDQGNYLREAVALAYGDFSPEKYFYPPLYPLLGAPFTRWFGQHPFIIIDLSCFYIYCTVFLRFARLFTARWAALGLLLCSVMANRHILENFLIPWTTTLSAALLSIVILGLIRLWESRPSSKISYRHVVAAGLAAGLVVAVRPLDVLVAGVLWLIFWWRLWCLHASMKLSVPRVLRLFCASAVALGVGPLLFVSFNLLVYGAPLGAYLSATSSNGYYLADLAEKFISIALDGYSLYLEPQSGLLAHYPWMIASLLAMLYIVMQGNWLLIAIAGAICLQYALYLPYGDLLPTGLWRYLNIHYFKWTVAYLALFAWLLPVLLIKAWQKQKRTALVQGAILALCAFVLLGLHFDISVKNAAFSGVSADEMKYPLTIDLPAEPVDFIDLREVRSGFLEIYFGAHHLWVDNHELHAVKNFRVLPAPWGSRILFIRPVVGQHVVFQPDSRIAFPAQSLSVGVGSYHFALGMPRWPGADENIFQPKDYKLGDTIDFSTNGNSDGYLGRGWSNAESWGRWSDGRKAILRLQLNKPPLGALTLQLRAGAFLWRKHSEQNLNITANDRFIGGIVFDAAHGGAIPSDVSFELPAGIVKQDGQLELELAMPDAVSPEKLGLSADPRKLGVGVTSLRLSIGVHE